jgi:hypothetical protein
MFLAEPDRTQFDLSFRLGHIPVRIHPFFWVMSLAMGWSLKAYGLEYLLLWVVCVFVSILFHELGHVVAGQWFGSSGHIVLYSFGGLAVGSNQLSKRWQRIVVCAAGPGANFLLVAILAAILAGVRPDLATHLWQRLLHFSGCRLARLLRRCSTRPWSSYSGPRGGAVNLLPVWPRRWADQPYLFTGYWGLAAFASLIVSIATAAVMRSILADHPATAHPSSSRVASTPSSSACSAAT